MAGKRFLVFTHLLDLTGMPFITLQTARTLIDRGGVVRVISPIDGPLRNSFEALGATVQVMEVQGGRFRKLWLVANFLRSLLMTLCFRPHAIYASTALMYHCVHVGRWLGIPVVWNIQDSWAKGNECLPKTRFFWKVLQQNPHLVFAAAATHRLWKPHLGDSPVTIVPNGISRDAVDRFLEGFDREAVRERMGIPKATTVITIIGTTIRRKRQDLFVEAALRLIERRLDTVHFLVVGCREGSFLDSLRNMVLAHRSINRFQFIGETPDVFTYLGISDIFCCCSSVESHPLVILEAMAFGLPIVSSNVWGIPEQVADEDTALLFESGQVIELTSKIDRLLDDPELRRALGDAARIRFEERFTSAHYEQAMGALFRKVAM